MTAAEAAAAARAAAAFHRCGPAPRRASGPGGSAAVWVEGATAVKLALTSHE